MKPAHNTSISSRGAQVVSNWGRQIRAARQARGFTQAELAERARIGLQTLVRMEAGQSGTALGMWINVLEVLGMLSNLESLADPVTDVAGRAALGQRVRRADPHDDLDF